MSRLHSTFVAAVAASVLASCAEGTGKTGTNDSAATDVSPSVPANAIDLSRGVAADYFDLSAGPDGRVVFTRVVDGYAAIFVADSNGADPKRVTDGIWDFSPKFSPDGKWIAFGRETQAFDVLLVSADSSAARPLAATAAVENLIGWLPDGSGVLYSKNTGTRNEIWIAAVDGKQSSLIARNGDVHGSASPDGKWLAYHLIEKGKRTLWLYDFATAKSRQLTTEGYEHLGEETNIWSPDSKRFVYESTRSGTHDIWSIDVTTGATRQITADVRDDDQPSFSPDGSHVAFISNRGGQVDVWVASDTGGDAVRVTDDRALEETPEWTRDGKSLLVASNAGVSHAYLSPINGGAARRLVSGDVQQTQLSLSRDGRHLALTTFDGSQNDVVVMPVDGGVPTVVADGPRDEFAPAISPDGQRVAFISNRAGNPDVYVAPIGGGEPTRLADWSSAEQEPLWSPDGRWLAFRSGHESASDVWLVKTDGTGARRLTKFGMVSEHSWSNDGQMLVVWAATSRGGAVYAVSVSDGAVRTIADGVYGRGSFAPGDSLVLVVNLAEGLARQELRRLDGTIALHLSARDGLVYEIEGRISPDGTMRAFPKFTFKNNDYLPTVQPLSGGEPKRLHEARGTAEDITWLPDSKSIVYVFRGSNPRIYRVPVK